MKVALNESIFPKIYDTFNSDLFGDYLGHNGLSNHEQSKELRCNGGNFDKLL